MVRLRWGEAEQRSARKPSRSEVLQDGSVDCVVSFREMKGKQQVSMHSGGSLEVGQQNQNLPFGVPFTGEALG